MTALTSTKNLECREALCHTLSAGSMKGISTIAGGDPDWHLSLARDEGQCFRAQRVATPILTSDSRRQKIDVIAYDVTLQRSSKHDSYAMPTQRPPAVVFPPAPRCKVVAKFRWLSLTLDDITSVVEEFQQLGLVLSMTR